MYTNRIVITFSHFLPRIDLMPSFISHKHMFPVLRTALLDKQIRKLLSTLHVYGHSISIIVL